MEDYRVKTGWRTHPKRMMVEAELGRDGVLAVMDLWGFCAMSRTDGDLSGMSSRAIAVAAGWTGDANRFVEVLTDPEIRLLDGEPGSLRIHDLDDHNPYVTSHGARSTGSKKAAHERWASAGKCKGGTQWCDERCGVVRSHADSNADACEPHQSAMPDALPGNAQNEDSIDPQCPIPRPSSIPSSSSKSIPSAQPGCDETRNKTVDDLRQELQQRFDRPLETKWWELAEKHAPFSTRELDDAFREAEKDGRRNAGTVVRILERYRSAKPAKPRGGTGPRDPKVGYHPGSEWTGDENYVGDGAPPDGPPPME